MQRDFGDFLEDAVTEVGVLIFIAVINLGAAWIVKFGVNAIMSLTASPDRIDYWGSYAVVMSITMILYLIKSIFGTAK